MKKIYIIDVSVMFFRAYYAVRPLTSPQGLPVNALYGYLSMLIKLLKDEKPDYLALCYDLKEPSFRKDLYNEYKSNRTEMPEDLVKQIPYLRKLNEALNFSSFEKVGYEADDLVGTISEWSIKHELEVYIVSGDKDFAQLVRPHLYLFDTMKNIKLDEDGVLKKWGVRPDQFCDYLALIGDSSDNVPGVSGIGPKGGQKLISEYGSLDNVYNNIENVVGKTKEKLINDKEKAYLSKKLVTIVRDVAVDFNLEDLKLKGFDQEKLQGILDELNFKSFQKSLLTVSNSKEETLDTDKGSANSDIEPIEVLLSSEFLGRFANQDNYLLIDKGSLYASNQQGVWQIKHDSDKEMEWPHNYKWKGFDLKSIWHFLNIKNISQPQIELDSMLLAYVLKPKNCTDIHTVLKDILGVEKDSISSAREIFEEINKLNEKLESDLKNFDQASVLYHFEYPLIAILYKMERVGFLINSKELNQFSEELAREIQEIELEVFKISGDKFDLASPKQLSE
ncbi:MAG: DNA polymerase I, partial [Bdellovibrionales bacterium]|nr:DNA polymerase I [Bdellovibrionales bacterium]